LTGDGLVREVDIRRALRWLDDSSACPEAQQERDELVTTLAAHGWDTARAAAVMGVHRVTIYRRMRRLGIRPPRFGGLLDVLLAAEIMSHFRRR
jgi:transcriptional regulator of acetoin/glycerol metabolism